MDIQHKLEILADAAKYDVSCASSGARRPGNDKDAGHTDGMGFAIRIHRMGGASPS